MRTLATARALETWIDDSNEPSARFGMDEEEIQVVFEIRDEKNADAKKTGEYQGQLDAERGPTDWEVENQCRTHGMD